MNNKFFINSKILVHMYLMFIRLFNFPSKLSSADYGEKITLVIPAIDKDKEILESVIVQANKNIKHKIVKTIVICPKKSKGLTDLVSSMSGVVIINDEKISPLNIKSLKEFKPKGIDRSGWILQQLLKFAIHSEIDTRKYLVIDADTLMTKPQCYISKGKSALLFSDEYHVPYRQHIKKVLGFYPKYKVSFVSHAMLFDVSIVSDMLKKIEVKSSKPWYTALIENINKNEISSMSEYEMYASFLLKYYKQNIYIEYWNNKSVSRKRFKKDKKNKFSNYTNYRSVSYHSYNK
jgi:hypothetical protein